MDNFSRFLPNNRTLVVLTALMDLVIVALHETECIGTVACVILLVVLIIMKIILIIKLYRERG